MQTIIRPILLMISFFMLFWMLNIVFIFISFMQVNLILQQSVYTVEKYGGYTKEAESEIEINLKKYQKDYTVNVSNHGLLDYGETTEITVEHEYSYFVLNKNTKLVSSLIVLGKEI